MDEKTAVHICRNPHGHSIDEQREASNTVCDRLESTRESYLNMREFAEDNGLDTTAYHGP